MTTKQSQDIVNRTYHSSHGRGGVVGVEVGGPPHSLLLDHVGSLVRGTCGHHVVGWVGGVAASARGRRGVGCDFW